MMDEHYAEVEWQAVLNRPASKPAVYWRDGDGEPYQLVPYYPEEEHAGYWGNWLEMMVERRKLKPGWFLIMQPGRVKVYAYRVTQVLPDPPPPFARRV